MNEFVQSIVSFLGATSNEQIPVIVAFGLLVLFVAGFLNLLPKSVAAGLMISLGIFGTFWGISNALQPLDFSEDKMNDSVQALLDGMKAAFYTSLFGLGTAIASRFFWESKPYYWVSQFLSKLISRKKHAKDPAHQDMNRGLDAIKQAIIGEDDGSLKNVIAGDGDSSLVTQLQKLRDESRDGFKKLEGLSDTIRDVLNEGLNDIKRSIIGEDDGDSSLVTQLQKLCDESRDGFKKLEGLSDTIRDVLVKNLESMLTKLTEDLKTTIADQLGGQLRELTQSIETALIEQFGKTFVEFNDAVQALKKWQEDHRQQVEQLTAAFDQSAQGIKEITANCSAIPSTMQALQQAVDAANSQITQLTETLGAFADMKDKAAESFPLIKQRLDSIGEDLKNSAAGFHQLEQTINEGFTALMQQLQDDMTQTQQELTKIITDAGEKFRQQMEGMSDGMRASTQQLQADMDESKQLLTRIINDTSQEFRKQMEEMAGGMRENMENSQRDINSSIEKIAQGAQTKLNEEIQRITAAWGDNMVAIARECQEAINTAKKRRQ